MSGIPGWLGGAIGLIPPILMAPSDLIAMTPCFPRLPCRLHGDGVLSPGGALVGNHHQSPAPLLASGSRVFPFRARALSPFGLAPFAFFGVRDSFLFGLALFSCRLPTVPPSGFAPFRARAFFLPASARSLLPGSPPLPGSRFFPFWACAFFLFWRTRFFPFRARAFFLPATHGPSFRVRAFPPSGLALFPLLDTRLLRAFPLWVRAFYVLFPSSGYAHFTRVFPFPGARLFILFYFPFWERAFSFLGARFPTSGYALLLFPFWECAFSLSGARSPDTRVSGLPGSLPPRFVIFLPCLVIVIQYISSNKCIIVKRRAGNRAVEREYFLFGNAGSWAGIKKRKSGRYPGAFACSFW
jgi:hypothetical protein